MPDFNKHEKRLAEIFERNEVPNVTAETLMMYLDCLEENIELPCI